MPTSTRANRAARTRRRTTADARERVGAKTDASRQIPANLSVPCDLPFLGNTPGGAGRAAAGFERLAIEIFDIRIAISSDRLWCFLLSGPLPDWTSRSQQ
jgi:hypothetical protein